MESTRDTPADRSEEPLPARSGLRASLPLLVVSSVLFGAGVLLLGLAPHARPDGFPLWGFLLTLGAMAALGATFLAFSSPASTTPPAPEVREGPLDPVPGRPVPEVRRGPAEPPAAASWDESALPLRRSGPPLRPVVVQVLPPDDVERALAEIQEIEDQLEVRPPARSVAAPARG